MLIFKRATVILLCGFAIALKNGQPVGKEVFPKAESAPSCNDVCAELALDFGPYLHYPSNDNLTVWDAKQQEVRSVCRVESRSSVDVSKVLKLLVDSWCHFSVKGGGHARNADDSISVGGVTIDMQEMKSIEISSNRTKVKLGSGHTLYTLYSGLEPYNLTTIGGRVADVGLGGFALGGGISDFSPKYGLALDNIFEYEVVLANATIVTVNENQHPDLYFALRGGMNNFGIVTYFTMRLLSQGEKLGGSTAYSVDKKDNIAEEAYKLTTVYKNDTNLSFSYGYAYYQDSDEFRLSFSRAYSQPILNPMPFEGLSNIPNLSSTVRIDWPSNFALEATSGLPPGGRNLFATVTYQPSIDMDKAMMQIMEEEIQNVKTLPGFFPNVIAQPIPEAVIRAGKDRGGNALGIEADGPLTASLLTVLWSEADDDQTMYALAERWIARAEAATIEAGLYNRWMYINYAFTNQDPFSGYGQVNRKRLQEIQTAVDPMGVFTSQGLCRGYFKLQ